MNKRLVFTSRSDRGDNPGEMDVAVYLGIHTWRDDICKRLPEDGFFIIVQMGEWAATVDAEGDSTVFAREEFVTHLETMIRLGWYRPATSG